MSDQWIKRLCDSDDRKWEQGAARACRLPSVLCGGSGWGGGLRWRGKAGGVPGAGGVSQHHRGEEPRTHHLFTPGLCSFQTYLFKVDCETS